MQKYVDILGYELDRAFRDLVKDILASSSRQGISRLVKEDPKRLTVVLEEVYYDTYNECWQQYKRVYFLKQMMGLNGRLRNKYEVDHTRMYF